MEFMWILIESEDVGIPSAQQRGGYGERQVYGRYGEYVTKSPKNDTNVSKNIGKGHGTGSSLGK